MNSPIIGILGGMGPLASSEFVNCLYKKCYKKFQHEQHYPRILLISDPTIPDRMNAIQDKKDKEIIDILENKIHELLFLGATHIIICCFTAHYFIKSLSSESQERIIHLGSTVTNYLDQHQKPTLILCSKLLAKTKLIRSRYAIYPEEKHLSEIHRLIYEIKLNGPQKYKNELILLSQELGKSYGVSRVLFACTEFHLIYQMLENDYDEDHTIQFLDGLSLAAHFIINLCTHLEK